MDYTTILLSFPMLTHMHDFDNHSDGYGHPKIVLMRSVSGQLGITIVNRFKLRHGSGQW
jgi:hypothetical protein